MTARLQHLLQNNLARHQLVFLRELMSFFCLFKLLNFLYTLNMIELEVIYASS